LTVYNELNAKYSQVQIDYESIQSLVQQKNEAYLQCQNELNTYQNLLYHQKKKSDDIDLLHSTLNEREIQYQQLITNEKQLLFKQSELELNVKFLEEKTSKLISNQQLFEQIQLDLKRITHERDLAIVEKKQLENKMELNQEKICQYEEREQKLTNEIERLFQLDKSLQDQLNTNNEQSRQELLMELETLKYDYAKTVELNTNLNNQIQYLQNNLEQFQQGKIIFLLKQSRQN
jgi:chromosome segregation ATPase